MLLEGAWSGDTFEADSALIRHDENYEVPEEGGALPGGLMLAFLGSAGVIRSPDRFDPAGVEGHPPRPWRKG